MTARAELGKVTITEEEVSRAFCHSRQALGNATKRDMADIIYVKPQSFDPGRTPDIAMEIGKINASLVQAGRKFLLIGPGRWGSADRWLGIPVTWKDISGVGAMVETTSDKLRAEPSQGSHFFHNITSLGINYMTVREKADDFLDWQWLMGQPIHSEGRYVAHLQLTIPMTLKVDGRRSRCVMYV
jgi:hypothetical protein